MSLAQVIKTELYKNSRRKSSLILFIPMLLAIVVTFGYAHGVIELNLTTGGTGAYSCMDFIFIVWNVLSGLGIMGILLILFAAFQFSGEIERGQIKLMLLRIGKRSTVVLGKYLATVIAAVIFIIGTLLVCIGSYYLFVSGSSMGTGTFASTIDGFSTMSIWGSIALQVLMYLFLIGITFFVGLFVNPFVTFILAIVIMYAGNYLAGAENAVSKLLPAYWSNQLMLNETVSNASVVISICFIVILTMILMLVTTALFRKQDIK
jgi:ABC-type transport system involved in multi-copper enzyme maturation permease subunit